MSPDRSQRDEGHLPELKRIEILEEKRCLLEERGLFPEVQERMKRDIREHEWVVYHLHIEQAKRILRRERERMLENVLPSRYTLASLNLQPLALEYIVGKEMT